MKKNQLSEAIGGVDQALVDEAMRFAGTKRHRGWGRVALVAACLAAALTVTAAAVGLANGWKLSVESADENGPWQQEGIQAGIVLHGRTGVSAYPLSEDVVERISAQQMPGEPTRYASVRDVENDFGIRLLRIGSEQGSREHDPDVWAGIFSEDVHPEGGVYVTGNWVTNNGYWSADTTFRLSTTDIVADEDIAGIGYLVKRVEQTVDYDIKALGVPTQLAVVVHSDSDGGECREVVAFFVYDNIAYSINFITPVREDNPQPGGEAYPGEADLIDWACERLETLRVG